MSDKFRHSCSDADEAHELFSCMLILQKTLNPVFDECFEFGTITLEQCTLESAMIGFTVMDHDVITANDFAGEAFLSLNNIPGVAELNLGVENFHGLKPIDLVLMQQKDKRESSEKLFFLALFNENLHRPSDPSDTRDANTR